MAYGIKYQFKFQSTNGVDYVVNIVKDGYSGSIIDRPLGGAPILRKSTNGCIHSTSLDLTLECQVALEYAEFYSADPGEFKVVLFRNNVEIWQGSLVNELYSAPEIAPPYDVKVTASDGISLAKEYIYEPQGEITPKELIKNLLADVPGLGRSINIISGIGATDLTPSAFWNSALINLDYMAGETKYDVLTYFLDTIHATITTHNGNWLIVRETDVTISSGSLPCLLAPRNSSSITSSSITGAVQSAGQMGVATLWPIGHMTSKAVPAKRRVTVEAEYHLASGAPSVADDEWDIADSDHALFLGGTYILTYAVNDSDYGQVYADIPLRCFTRVLTLTVRASTYLGYVYNNSELRIYVRFTPTGGTAKYYNGLAWVTSMTPMVEPDLPDPVGTIENPEEYSYDIPPLSDFSDGVLDITFYGRRVRIYDAVLNVEMGSRGHRDVIVIDNGARGDGDTTTIAGARVTGTDVVAASFLQGIFLHSTSAPVENFYDNNFTGLTFMSLTAMGYALSVALARVELSGTFNIPASLADVPLVVTYGGVDYWVESFDLNVVEEEMKLTAISLPSATLTVESETVTELSESGSTGASGGSGGGGGGGGSYTLPVASASTLGGIKVGSGLSIDGAGSLSASATNLGNNSTGKIATIGSTDIYNDVKWGGTSGGMTQLTVNGTQKKVLTEGWSELPTVSGSDNGKVLKVVSGAWAAGTESGGGGSTVSWGTESGNVAPLSVNGTSKDLYKYPSGGIPSTDMASAVQTSLGLADTALQAVPSDYKKVVLCADEAAYQAITTKDSNTLYLIPET